MTPLRRFRSGWENEHMAAFLLSRIAFISSPANVSDDIGVDFICTRFQEESGFLYPEAPFAVQVKSSKRSFKFTFPEYLDRLSMPFVVGVLSRSSATLDLYSGNSIPMFFSKVGLGGVRRLEIELIDDLPSEDCQGWKEKRIRGSFTIYMPLIASLGVADSRDKQRDSSESLQETCTRSQFNISSRRVGQHVYLTRSPGRAVIMAGSGSAETFRRNFHWRLAEYFQNLVWIGENCSQDLSQQECAIYSTFYEELRECFGRIPIVEEAYDRLQAFFERTPTEAMQLENLQEDNLPTGADFVGIESDI